MEWSDPTWIAVASLAYAGIGLAAFPRHRDELLSGRPGRTALAVLTGRYRRIELEEICGLPDDEDRYLVPPERVIALPRRGFYSYLGNSYDDLGLATLAIWIFYWRPTAPGLAGWLATLCLVWLLWSVFAAIRFAWIIVREDVADEE